MIHRLLNWLETRMYRRIVRLSMSLWPDRDERASALIAMGAEELEKEFFAQGCLLEVISIFPTDNGYEIEAMDTVDVYDTD